MLQADQTLKLLLKEINIIQTLAKKIDPATLDFKPKEGMRSTQELLSYLQNCAYGMLDFWTQDQLSMKDHFAKLREETPLITLDNFEQRMELQKENLQKKFAEITESEWQSKIVKYPWGEEAPLGEAVVHTGLKWLSAYKYQLFMYMKLSSDTQLSTPDAWVYGA